MYKTVKVNQSHYRPEVARGFQEVTVAQDVGKVVSLTHRPLLPQEIFLVFISVRG